MAKVMGSNPIRVTDACAVFPHRIWESTDYAVLSTHRCKGNKNDIVCMMGQHGQWETTHHTLVGSQTTSLSW